ncbi:hypothetical protein EWC71_01190 [Salmonella enterica subsp. enterica serovar Oranienburg]|nr:hypothetical protein [Salmonella enterica subsp. enterica serovar Oranienburg]EBW2932052.1 hypothetical protein [Salmonella enterica subsp. enterica serovar Oranienburg]EBY1268410.1 hypothetical protein [Salmonella enterica subsp. enterica serovar Oranienburg]ECD1404195.1 hypothetical protein [Salmonella enterica subsp. enterica serovar Oranienburg]
MNIEPNDVSNLAGCVRLIECTKTGEVTISWVYLPDNLRCWFMSVLMWLSGYATCAGWRLTLKEAMKPTVIYWIRPFGSRNLISGRADLTENRQKQQIHCN